MHYKQNLFNNYLVNIGDVGLDNVHVVDVDVLPLGDHDIRARYPVTNYLFYDLQIDRDKY